MLETCPGMTTQRSNNNTTRHPARRSAPCSARSDSPSAPRPCPCRRTRPGPTTTDDLLPMMTLGCGEARLDRVPSAQTIASPERMPRLPSSQLTSTPCRVQACASAGPAPSAAIRGDAESRPPAPDDGHAVLRRLSCRHDRRRLVTGFRFKAQHRASHCSDVAATNYRINSIDWGNFAGRARASLAKVVLPLQERPSGEMAEWLKAHAWKACVRETVPWVRIPLSPPEVHVTI